MPLKFTAKGTVKVNGIREAGESNRSIAENYGVHESTLIQRQGRGTVPTSLFRFKYKVENEEEKESPEYCRDFVTRLCGQLSEC
jgi:IS30 family transposase